MIEYDNIDDVLVKVVLGESTEEELRFVQVWRAESAANERYFQDFKRIWDESRHLAMKSEVDEEVAWGNFKERVREGQVVEMRPRKGYGWLVAAAILVIAVGGWFFFSSRPAEYLAVSSGGQVLLDTLPEGSVVTLNKQSSIRYIKGFAGADRRVDMEGEAFFAVAQDKERPFVVHTNGMTITVLGTSFNVRNTGEKTEVIVEMGMVEVRKGAEVVRVRAHERVTVTGDEKPVKGENPDQLYDYYRTHVFECNGTPLSRLVEKLNEVYQVHVVIGNAGMRNMPVTVSFEDESLDRILEIINQTFPGSNVHRN
ncbi:MAG: FecR domain-containing protein [Bacteroidetes bacterium]|nr:FecR domain-containing protein [Bacteroidota bacterium]